MSLGARMIGMKRVVGAGLAVAWVSAAAAQPLEPDYPTTEFEEGASSASVSADGITATIDLVRRDDVDPEFDTPVLSVTVGGKEVLEVAGVAAGFDFPVTDASIANIDPDNGRPEVYFASYSGGAHCCTQVIVATETEEGWEAVTIGAFDGDGFYLSDLDGDGLAEISTYDNRFLYRFGCYACSAAPLIALTVRDGKAYDISANPGMLPAHRDWLGQIEDMVDPAERWTSPGFLAGWIAAKFRVGEGEAAWAALTDNWDFANDQGEEVCLTGQPLDECPRRQRAVLNFPERLKLFLEETGYIR